MGKSQQKLSASPRQGKDMTARRLFLESRQWFDRAQSEANLASEFAFKLTAARSLPEVMAAYQKWTSRRFEMMAEDGKHLLADTQKFMEVGVRLLSNGSLINGGKGVGT
jgi:hypothetical protein